MGVHVSTLAREYCKYRSQKTKNKLTFAFEWETIEKSIWIPFCRLVVIAADKLMFAFNNVVILSKLRCHNLQVLYSRISKMKLM